MLKECILENDTGDSITYLNELVHCKVLYFSVCNHHHLFSITQLFLYFFFVFLSLGTRSGGAKMKAIYILKECILENNIGHSATYLNDLVYCEVRLRL